MSLRCFEPRFGPLKDRKVRFPTLSTPTFTIVGGKHTLAEYISLYRQGKVGPLSYEFSGVPIVLCRMCDNLRPRDGTPCQSCGAYQHCTPDTQGADSRIIGAQLSAAARVGARRPINPRRSIRNGSR